jgi:type IV pilus assembly protein PilE
MRRRSVRLQKKSGRTSGFTLIEVIVVMVILAVLAAIAIPNYTEYIQRGRRAEAKAQLLQVAQWLERFRTENNRYDQTLAGAALALPASLSRAPATGAIDYNIALTAVGFANYTVTATAAGRMASDSCGNFSINNLGRRQVIIAGTAYDPGTAQFERCWGR